MGHWRVGLATAALACVLAWTAHDAAQAVPLGPQGATVTKIAPVLQLVNDRRARFHGKRVQTAYCLRRNYWWFYRPYTTAEEDFPRCEPYFHYPDEAYGARGARAQRDHK